jgi:hypothetical protein
MEQKLIGQDLELYRRIDEVLFYLWDPIGVNEAPEARDEYYSYLPEVFSMVQSNASAKEIAVYLQKIVREAMGLTVSAESLVHNQKIASLLLKYKESVDSKVELTSKNRFDI